MCVRLHILWVVWMKLWLNRTWTKWVEKQQTLLSVVHTLLHTHTHTQTRRHLTQSKTTWYSRFNPSPDATHYHRHFLFNYVPLFWMRSFALVVCLCVCVVACIWTNFGYRIPNYRFNLNSNSTVQRSQFSCSLSRAPFFFQFCCCLYVCSIITPRPTTTSLTRCWINIVEIAFIIRVFMFAIAAQNSATNKNLARRCGDSVYGGWWPAI